MTHALSQNFKMTTLLKFALPSIVMMVFTSLYTIIDGIFVSRLVGSSALSAINIVYPIISLIIAIGVMLATGGSATIAKKFGENKAHEACNHFTLFILTGSITGIIIAFGSSLFIEPIVKLLGANASLKQDAMIYLGTLLKFAPACILQLLFQSYFVTAGRPQIGLVLTILAGITNAVLDYLFMGPLALGI